MGPGPLDPASWLLIGMRRHMGINGVRKSLAITWRTGQAVEAPLVKSRDVEAF